MSFICDSGKLLQVRRTMDPEGLVASIAQTSGASPEDSRESAVPYLLKIHGSSDAVYEQWADKIGSDVVFYGHLDTEEEPSDGGMIVHALAAALTPESWLKQH